MGRAIDPVAGGGDSCAAIAPSPEPGTATYSLPSPRRAYTMLGAPTIVARLKINGAAPGVSQIAGRLWDVAPDGTRTLVARGLYRPTDGRNVWQLHPGAWRFVKGHSAQLELLGGDPPFARPSNGTFQIDVRRLRLTVPVRQRADCTTVRPVSRPPLPPGERLAPGVPRRPRPSCHRRR